VQTPTKFFDRDPMLGFAPQPTNDSTKSEIPSNYPKTITFY
jgi:hypothetical protein